MGPVEQFWPVPKLLIDLQKCVVKAWLVKLDERLIRRQAQIGFDTFGHLQCLIEHHAITIDDLEVAQLEKWCRHKENPVVGWQ